MKNVEIILDEIVARLSTVDGVKTCSVGLEPDINPASYPMIRVVPTRLAPIEANRRKFEVIVYYGTTLQAFDGMKPLYDALLKMERDIVGLMVNGDGYRIKHLATITDEDRLQAYKLFASTFEVQG